MTTAAALAQVVDQVRAVPVVGFDTEFVGEHTYEPVLCLIQVATSAGFWVVDPLSGIDLAEFWAALTAPGREVVALAARQEIVFCLRFAGRPPALVFDPQVAAGLVGLGYPLSHTNLVRKALGVQVPPGEAFTDWRERPLRPRQLAYAAADVEHLLPLRAHLWREAEKRGRAEWIERECSDLVERVIAGEREERWLRGSGASSLNRRALGVLREVWRWREATARNADVPPRRIMGDDVMVEVAKRGPRTTEDLFALRGLERTSVRRAGSEVVAAVQRGINLPEAELPSVRRRDDPPQVGVLSQLAAVVANGLAAEHEVDPALLATSADLHEFVRWQLGLGDGARPEVLHGWRGAILGDPLVALLEGRSAVRVSNPRSANPLGVEPLC